MRPHRQTSVFWLSCFEAGWRNIMMAPGGGHQNKADTAHTHTLACFMCLTHHVKVIPPCPGTVELYSREGSVCDSLTVMLFYCQCSRPQCSILFTMLNSIIPFVIRSQGWGRRLAGKMHINVRVATYISWSQDVLSFPGDEDVPHVQHGQHQCWVQAEGRRKARGEADGTLRAPGRPPDAALPRHAVQHQVRWEACETLQCQENREDEGEGEQSLVCLGRGTWWRAAPERSTCCHADLCACLINDLRVQDGLIANLVDYSWDLSQLHGSTLIIIHNQYWGVSLQHLLSLSRPFFSLSLSLSLSICVITLHFSFLSHFFTSLLFQSLSLSLSLLTETS